MQNHLSWLNYLKIRASYGEVGNNRISGGRRFPYLTRIDFNNTQRWGSNGLTKKQIGASNLHGEVARKYNPGLDLWNAFYVDWETSDRRPLLSQQYDPVKWAQSAAASKQYIHPEDNCFNGTGATVKAKMFPIFRYVYGMNNESDEQEEIKAKTVLLTVGKAEAEGNPHLREVTLQPWSEEGPEITDSGECNYDPENKRFYLKYTIGATRYEETLIREKEVQ